MIEVETLYHKVLESIDLSQEVDDAELMNLITHILREEEQKSYITLKEKIRIGRELFNAFRKLNILQELVEIFLLRKRVHYVVQRSASYQRVD